MSADELLLEKAIAFATQAHAGQTDKAGKPYITHPMRVMDQMDGTEAKIAAILHDVLEDTDHTADDLRDRLGLPDNILEAVLLLTRSPGMDYMDYVRRLADCPLAAAVKRADLQDNMDLTRLPQITEKDKKRCEKYRSALNLLSKNHAPSKPG